HLRADMNRRVGPVDKLAVHPDLRGLFHGRNGTQASDRSVTSARVTRAMSSGESPTMWFVEPAPAQTNGWRRSSRSSSTFVASAAANGATAPGSTPDPDRTS